MYKYIIDDHYVFENWTNFTTLTDKEMYNLQCIIKSKMKRVKNKKEQIICVETKEIFPSIEDLAAKLKTTKHTLTKYIKLNARYYGENKEYQGKTFNYFSC